MNRFKNKNLAKLLGGALALSPLAVVIACNNNAAKPTETTTSQALASYTAALKALKVAPAATHANLVWAQAVPQLPEALTKLYRTPVFIARSFSNEASALATPASEWSATLPQRTAVENTARFLWARFEALPGSSEKSMAFDLSATSNLSTVPVAVDQLADFASYKLSDVKLSGTPTAPVVSTNLTPELAKFAKLQFQVGTVWLDESGFKQYLTDNAAQVTSSFVANLKVRLVARETERAILTSTATDEPSSSDFIPTPVVAKTLDDFLNQIQAYKLNLTTSVHSELAWVGTAPTLDAAVTNYEQPEYSVASFADEAAALSDTGNSWSATLPTATAAAAAERSLWVRVRVKVGSDTEKTQVRNLLTASGLDRVRVSIDALTTFASFDLAAVSLKGTPAAAEVTTNLSDELLTYAKVQWRVGTDWLDEAAFKAYLAANPNLVTTTFVSGLKVRLSALNDEVARLTSTLEASPVTAAFTPTPTKTIDDFLTSLADLKLNLTTSTHSALVWSGEVPQLDASLTSYDQPEYSTAGFSDEAAALADTSSSWTRTLPTSTAIAASERSLWVRVKVNSASSTLKSVARNLTTSSELPKVLVGVDSLASFNSFNLANVTLTGSPASPAVTTNLATPLSTYVEVQWLVGTTWYKTSDFTTYLSANTASVTADFVSKLRVKLVVLDSTVAVLASTSEVVPTTSGFTATTLRTLADFLTAIDDLRVNLLTSKHSELQWGTVPALSDTVTNYNQPEYSTAEFSDEAAAIADTSAVWSTTLPTSVLASHDARNLWVRVRVKVASDTEKSVARNLTTSSALRDVKVAVDDLADFSSFDLTKVTLTGTPANPVINTKLSDTLATYAKVQWKYDTEWVDTNTLLTYLSANVKLITSDFLAKLQVKLVTKDESLALVNSTTVAEPDTSAFSPTILKTVNDFLAAAALLKVNTTTSTHSALDWGTNLPALDKDVTNYEAPEYTTANFADAAAAIADTAATWTTTLPSSIAAKSSERSLWVRVRIKATATSGQSVAQNLTDSSQVKSVKVSVDNLDAFANFDLTGVTLSGTPKVPVITTSLPDELADYVKVQWQYDGTNWVDESAFKTYLSANIYLAIPSFVSGLKVRLTNLDNTVSQLASTTTSSPATVNFEPTPVRTVEDFLTAITTLEVSTSSTHNSLNWGTDVPVLDPTVLGYDAPEYSTSNFANQAAAINDTSATWSSTLPTETNATAAQRYLWVRVKAKAADGSVQSVARNLTTTSNIRSVKVSVDDLSSFSNYRLTNVSLTGTPTSPVVTTNLPDELSAYVKVQWLVGTEWLDQADFITKLTGDIYKVIPAFVRALKVRLTNKDATTSVLASQTEATPTTSSFTATPVRTVSDYINAMMALRVNTTTSTHSELDWGSDVPELDPTVLDYEAPEYSTANFANQAEAIADTTATWTSTLPTSTSATVSERYLWVRVKPKSSAPSTVQAVARNLLSSSQLANVKVAIDDLASFSTFRLSDVKITGTPASPVITTNLSTELSTYVKVQWKVGEDWLDSTELTERFADDIYKVIPALVSGLRVRLFNTQENSAVLTSTATAIPNTTDFTPTPVKTVQEFLVDLRDNLSANAETSTHNKVDWGANVPKMDPTVLDYETPEYSTFNFSDENDALTNTSATWTTTLPTAFDAKASERHLWVRVRAKADKPDARSVAQQLTYTAKLDEVRTLVSAISDYSSLATVGVSMTGSSNVPVITYTLPAGLRDYLVVEFTFDNTTFYSQNDFEQYLQANAATIDAAKLATIKARWALLDSNASVLTLPTEAAAPAPTVSLTNFFTARDGVTDTGFTLNEDVAASFNSLAEFNTQLTPTAPASTHGNAIWTKRGVLTGALVDQYTLQYSTADYTGKTNAEILADQDVLWSRDFPTSFNAASAKRSLWMRLVPKDPSKMAQAQVRNLLATVNPLSTGVKALLVDIKALAGYRNFNFAALSVENPTTNRISLVTNPADPLADAELKTYAKLEYQIDGGDWQDLIGANGTGVNGYFIQNYYRMTQAMIDSIRVRLVPVDRTTTIDPELTRTPILTKVRVVESIRVIASSINDYMDAFTNNFRVTPGSTRTSFSFTGTPTLPANVATFAGTSAPAKYATTNPATGSYNTPTQVLPPTLNADPSKRFLFVRYGVVKADITYTWIRDVAVSSGLRDIP